MTSFWRNNDVSITSCVQGEGQVAIEVVDGKTTDYLIAVVGTGDGLILQTLVQTLALDSCVHNMFNTFTLSLHKNESSNWYPRAQKCIWSKYPL